MANKVIGISINLIILAFICFVGWLLIKPSEALPYCDEIKQPRPVGLSVRCKHRKLNKEDVKLTKDDEILIKNITKGVGKK